MSDYAADSEVRVYNHSKGGDLKMVTGTAGIQILFTRLFKLLQDKSDVSAPVIHCEMIDADLGQVFLIWRSPKNGYLHATDTFVINAEGVIVLQNVVTYKSEASPPASPQAA